MSPGAARNRFVVAALIVAGVVVLDQISKTWVARALADEPAHIVGDFIVLRYSTNPGAAFSMFTGQTPVLALLAIGITSALVWVLSRADSLGMTVGLALLLGGALGNLSDRLFRPPEFLHGEVVDFISVGRFPSFNVADSAITIGAVLVIWFGLRGDFERDTDTSDTGSSGD